MRVVVDDGYVINAEIYIPEGASAENPLPLIVISHGSYNNLDHQDINAIELSRRGYVVISSDAYMHGSSSVYVNSEDSYLNMVHLIEYACASYSFIDTDSIGVSGHSMGAMIASATAEYYFKQEALGLGENRLKAILNVGYDPQYEPYSFEGADGETDLTINWGVIAAKYDEWFFTADTGNPADYLESSYAISFINQLDGVDISGSVENGNIYSGTIDGEEYIRVIYQNTEIHPLNHFSAASAASQVDFFYNALGVPSGYDYLDPGNQIWKIKEGFNLVGLIGIFIFLVAFAATIMDTVPYFGELKAKQAVPCAPALSTGKNKATFWITYAINLVIPALLVVPVAYMWIGQSAWVPSTVTTWFGEPNTNELAGWTAVVAICILAVFLISYKVFGAGKGVKGIPEYWGVKTTVNKVYRSLMLALLTVGVAYVILFTSEFFFNVDYRIWVVDMRIFTANKIPFFIAYVPAFMLFYLVNSLLVNGGNRVEGMPDWLVTLISCISNIAGIAVLIFIQYSRLIGSGVFTFNSMRIVNLFPLIVLIPIGTIIGRKLFKITGSIYVVSVLVSILYTMMP
ncbi:MAG: hypothetical protein LIO86_06705, partial [Lachnospiraceae bacterium]|nr:hypothetical protein [Lachnospiraceae bacterium]